MITDAVAHASIPAARKLANRMSYRLNEESTSLLQQLAARRAQPLH